MALSRVVELFPEVAHVAAALARHDEVARRWDDESACAGMTVGGLAFHLAGQVHTAVRLLSVDPVDATPIPVAEHYQRAAWVTAALDDDANTSIRDSADAEAAAGPHALHVRLDADADALPRVLVPVMSKTRKPDTVRIPRQGWSLASADFLLTRTMEIVVHSDDLAASIGVETPQFPPDAAAAVIGLLASVATGRHGQTAVVRALSRPQRSAGPVSAF